MSHVTIPPVVYDSDFIKSFGGDDYWYNKDDNNHNTITQKSFTRRPMFATPDKWSELSLDEKMKWFEANEILSDNDMIEYKLNRLEVE